MALPPARRPSPGAVLTAVVAAGLVAVCVAAIGWRAGGGRWYVVRTASMGTEAPVGTLLLTRPTRIADVHVGELITFHAPGSDTVYSHAVLAMLPGGVRTKGRVNQSADGWVVTQHDLVGRVAHRVWGVGWVLRGLPLLLLLLAAVWIATAFARAGWRAPLRLLGTTIAVSVVAWLLRPWVGIERVGGGAGSHGATLRAVSTGVVPIRAVPRHGGTPVRLLDGQVGTVDFTHLLTHGAYTLDAVPSLTLGWWVALVLACGAPLIWTLAVGFAPVPEASP